MIHFVTLNRISFILRKNGEFPIGNNSFISRVENFWSFVIVIYPFDKLSYCCEILIFPSPIASYFETLQRLLA